MFCSTCYHCVQAVNEVKKDKLVMTPLINYSLHVIYSCCLALANAVQSFALNAQICQLSNQNFALEPKVLGEFRARTLLVSGTLYIYTMYNLELEHHVV